MMHGNNLSPAPATKRNGPKVQRPKFTGGSFEVRDSSLVSHVFYDPKTQILDAVFITKSGEPKKRYRYFGVNAQTFAEFVCAESMGKYFNAHVRQHAYQMIRERPSKARKK